MNPGSTVSFECDTYITNNRQMSSRALSSESRELCHLNITNCMIREVCRGVEWHCNVLSRTLSSKWYKLYCRYVTNSVIEIPRTLSSRVCAAASNSTATYLKLNYLNDTLLHRHITNSIIWVPQTLWSGVCAVASISGATCLLCNGEGVLKFGTNACIKCSGAGECMSRRTCVCVKKHACMCHDATVYVSWRTCMCLSFSLLIRISLLIQLNAPATCVHGVCWCATYHVRICDLTCWYVSIIPSYVWRLIHMCDMSHLHVWHVSNSFVCMCNGCHVCRCLCVVMSVFVSRVGRSHMVHAYVCHDLFARVICHVRMCECSLAIRWGQLCCNVLLLNTCRWTIVQQIPAWKSTLRKYLFQYIFSRRSSCNQEQSWFSTATLARPYVTHCNTLQHTLCNTLQHTLPSTDGDRHTSQTTLCFSVFWVKVWNGPETFDGQNRFGGCSRVVLCFQCVGGVMRILSGLNMTNLSVSRTLLSVYCEFWWRALSVPESTWLICLYQNFMIYILLWFLLSAYYCYLYYLCA